MQTTLTIRIDDELKKAAEAAAEKNDESLSQIVRRALRKYVEQNAQGDLLKDQQQRGAKHAGKNRR